VALPKKDVDLCVDNVYIRLTRDEAIASISLLIDNLDLVLAYAMMDWKQRRLCFQWGGDGPVRSV
jgi:hypothetical protein